MQGAEADPAIAPVTRQVRGHAAPATVPSGPERGQPLAAAVAELPVLDASGRQVPFGALFRERRAVVVFVRVSADNGAARSRDLASRLGWRLLLQLRLGGIGSFERFKAREGGPAGLWPFPLPSTRDFRNANRSTRFLY